MPISIDVWAILYFLLSVVSFIIAYFQGKRKGPVFNNAYFYASKQERVTMDREPHYRLSRDVFTISGIIFLLLTLQTVFDLQWLLVFILVVSVFMIVYAIVTSTD